MAKKRLKSLLILFLFIPQTSLAGEGNSFELLYFFSASCPHCIEAMPYLKELSKEFKVKGLLYGKEEIEGLPFPVQKGSKEIAERYGIKGVPSVVLLKDGVFRQRVSGVRDIKDLRIILRAFKMDAMSVSEVFEKMPEDEFIITGWIIHKGRYFDKDSRFFITDRQKEILIDPWLPLEAVKSSFKRQRPGLMSDVIDRPVVLKGRLVKVDSGYKINVKEEIRLK